jgi:hypothetical protein
MTEERWQHFRFDETCIDDPAELAALVAKMFAYVAIAPIGLWYVRRRPTVDKLRPFSGPAKYRVSCRFSVKIGSGPNTDDELLGFGLTEGDR